MTTQTTNYGFGIELDLPYAAAIEQVTAALKDEGFGVLTTIDVQHTLKQKLDADWEPYTILGACNPHLAHRALSAEHAIGLLLPCNVVVHAHGDGVRVDVADPLTMMQMTGNSKLDAVAQEASERLHRVLAALTR